MTPAAPQTDPQDNDPQAAPLVYDGIWAVASYRAGETGQILALAEALAEAAGLPWRRVDVDYQPWAATLGLLRLTTAAGAVVQPEGPWPTLLVSAGLKNEPICRWIAARSGGRTRVIFLGRTWAAPERFGLVVTTPQYRLKPGEHVLENPLTLHPINDGRLEQARQEFADQLGSAEPQIGVLLGGNSGPYRFDQRYARLLAEGLNKLARSQRARLLVSSSSRTPPAFFEQLCRQLDDGAVVHDWHSSAPNPYLGILAWSDALVVSADSIAMISEAVASGKTVLLSEPSVASTPAAWLYQSAMGWGHRRWTRDVSLVHKALHDLGLIRWLDEQNAAEKLEAAESPDSRPLSYLSETVAQVLKTLT